ncbi:MAG: beta-lactamase family protein [Planctomycetales bacterium]|nr:beta-lactamase family protein [Planctomycetales bacterium]
MTSIIRQLCQTLLAAFLLVSPSTYAAERPLPIVAPEAVGVKAESLREIPALIDRAIADGEMPGCVVLVGRRGKVFYYEAFGHRQIEPEPVAMTRDTVFDLASLTKPIATATSVMKLVDAGQVDLDQPAARYLPEFGDEAKREITVRQLLTHQSGLTPDNALGDYQHGRDEAWRRICGLKLVAPRGSKFMYSDVGFIVLGKLVERVADQPLDEFARRNIFAPLGMNDTGYLPSEPLRQRAAPTEQRDGRWMRGEVHDPRAYLLGGVAGHAGLFSTAEDLAVYAAAMADQGRFGDQRLLSEATWTRMVTSHDVGRGQRTLGWDRRTGYSINRGEAFSDEAFGHGGFTGTVIWIDPKSELFFVFLSNRLHPDGKGAVNRLAGSIATLVWQGTEKP